MHIVYSIVSICIANRKQGRIFVVVLSKTMQAIIDVALIWKE